MRKFMLNVDTGIQRNHSTFEAAKKRCADPRYQTGYPDLTLTTSGLPSTTSNPTSTSTSTR